VRDCSNLHSHSNEDWINVGLRKMDKKIVKKAEGEAGGVG